MSINSTQFSILMHKPAGNKQSIVIHTYVLHVQGRVHKKYNCSAIKLTTSLKPVNKGKSCRLCITCCCLTPSTIHGPGTVTTCSLLSCLQSRIVYLGGLGAVQRDCVNAFPNAPSNDAGAASTTADQNGVAFLPGGEVPCSRVYR